MSGYKSMIPSKRKADENDDAHPSSSSKATTSRNPLGILVANNVRYAATPSRSFSKEETYWKVQWRKPQTKKHKTWDDDGVLVVCGSKLILKGLDDRVLSTGTVSGRTGPIEEGATLAVGGKELEIDSSIPKDEYLSGRCFNSSSVSYTPLPPMPKFQVAVPVARKDVSGSSAKAPAALGTRPKIPLPKASTVQPKVPVPKTMDHPVDADYSSVRYYTVNWRKPQTKKFKTWDGDAYMIVTGNHCVMQDAAGRPMGTATWNQSWLQGTIIHIGSKEVEIDGLITEAEFQRQCSGMPPPEVEVSARTASAPFKPAVPKAAMDGLASEPRPKPGVPLFDPEAPGALVLPAPLANKAERSGADFVPVVVDPRIAPKLRPHQIEGVIFLYEAVMGWRRHEGRGAILADEMGLGKTLQAITLLWTLLRQTPYHPAEHTKGGEIGKAMIVCPVSLVANWRNEIWKWLGRDRIGVFTAEETKNIKQFNHSRKHDVLIIGYEKLRSVIDTLAYCVPKIDLIICDEGHRLKSANNKTSQMFDALKTKRRIILSGTPIQNDLSEFWAMADFCNPGLLGTYNEFKRIYEGPILRARMPNCLPKNKELGNARSEALTDTAKSFVLRRTAEVLASYLPPKYEYVVFIRPAQKQLDLMNLILNPRTITRLIRDGMSQALEMVNVLGKICTSPILLRDKPESQRSKEYKEMIELLPRHMEQSDILFSGKLIALVSLLQLLHTTTEEKVVVVSQYTKTLDLLEAICSKNRWSRTRLDGSVAQEERDKRVTQFNNGNQHQCFIFLLSLKAGGVGLNLVGASRLILLDSSWNPANDLQAMARIHRDGQTRPVHIYRFLTAGMIDEKIFMRQVSKMGLSDALMAAERNGKSKEDSFTPDELRDLFRYHPQTASHTHNLLDCDCAGSRALDENESNEADPAEDDDDTAHSDSDTETPSRGWLLASQVQEHDITAKAKKRKRELASLDEWTHINCMGSAGRQSIRDPLLRAMVNKTYAKDEPETETEEEETSSGSKLMDTLDKEHKPSKNEWDDEPAAGWTNMNGVPDGAVTFLFTKCSM